MGNWSDVTQLVLSSGPGTRQLHRSFPGLQRPSPFNSSSMQAFRTLWAPPCFYKPEPHCGSRTALSMTLSTPSSPHVRSPCPLKPLSRVSPTTHPLCLASATVKQSQLLSGPAGSPHALTDLFQAPSQGLAPGISRARADPGSALSLVKK